MSEYSLLAAKPTLTHLLTGNFEEIATQSLRLERRIQST